MKELETEIFNLIYYCCYVYYADFVILHLGLDLNAEHSLKRGCTKEWV